METVPITRIVNTLAVSQIFWLIAYYSIVKGVERRIRMMTLSIKEGSRSSLYTSDR